MNDFEKLMTLFKYAQIQLILKHPYKDRRSLTEQEIHILQFGATQIEKDFKFPYDETILEKPPQVENFERYLEDLLPDYIAGLQNRLTSLEFEVETRKIQVQAVVNLVKDLESKKVKPTPKANKVKAFLLTQLYDICVYYNVFEQFHETLNNSQSTPLKNSTYFFHLMLALEFIRYNDKKELEMVPVTLKTIENMLGNIKNQLNNYYVDSNDKAQGFIDDQPFAGTDYDIMQLVNTINSLYTYVNNKNQQATANTETAKKQEIEKQKTESGSSSWLFFWGTAPKPGPVVQGLTSETAEGNIVEPLIQGEGATEPSATEPSAIRPQ